MILDLKLPLKQKMAVMAGLQQALASMVTLRGSNYSPLERERARHLQQFFDIPPGATEAAEDARLKREQHKHRQTLTKLSAMKTQN